MIRFKRNFFGFLVHSKTAINDKSKKFILSLFILLKQNINNTQKAKAKNETAEISRSPNIIVSLKLTYFMIQNK